MRTAWDFQPDAAKLVVEGTEIAQQIADYVKRSKVFTASVKDAYDRMDSAQRAEWRVDDDDINDGRETWYAATGDAVYGILLTLERWMDKRTPEGIDDDLVEMEDLRKSFTIV